MRFLIFCLIVSSAVALKLHNKHPCDDKDCRAGRECVEVEGEAQCLCVISCPDHFKPVCGSEGVSYDNHCRLHQKACISGNPISIKHKGYCKATIEKLWKKKDTKKSLISKDDLEDELQNDLIDRLKENEKKMPQHQKGPEVCYGSQRNALRFLIVGYFEDELDKQEWHLEGMTYRESMWGWFYSCDTNKDKSITSEELLTCAKKVNFFARPGQDNELTKELCIDALLDDGDKNRDRMLDFEEFTRIMDPKYQPKEKQCSFKGKSYVDGEEVHVDCNQCVCAVGNWICASTDCKTEVDQKKKRFPTSLGHKSEIDNNIDIPFESSNDVIAHEEVTDLWMENNKKDKEKAKKAKEDKEMFDVDDNLFADFDDEEKDKKDKEDDEDEDLDMDEYYDNLYEKTKMKNQKKKKHQLEKALKEVKILRMKTESLKKLLKRQKQIDKTDDNEDEEEDYKDDNDDIVVEKEDLQPKKNLHKNKMTKSQKYYDDVFKNTKWNDLINWGDSKKLNKDKDYDLQNHL